MISAGFVGIQAETITPFHYHSLAIASGSATLPECISDIAMNYALAAVLGMMASVALPLQANYRCDLSVIPWRCSVLMAESSRLLPAQVQRLNMDAEGGLSQRLYAGASKGNLKDFYRIQEVSQGSIYKGVIFGENPFEITGKDELIVRIGKHRRGMLRLTPITIEEGIRLNAYTADIFGQTETVDRFLLHTLQLSKQYAIDEAQERVLTWI